MARYRLDRNIRQLNRVQPLDRAYNHLLQVLITRFQLERQEQSGGVKLEIEFVKKIPTIWNNLAKTNIQNKIHSFKSRVTKYQQELNEFLLEGFGDIYKFNDPSFPFRFASGGTLPIITIDKKEYYCLFYREIYPIGWNIANGATDTIFELIDPQHTIRRELGEELLIVHPARNLRYVFKWDTTELVDWPGFAAARHHFDKQYPGLNLGACKELKTTIEWSDGPDSLWVQYEDEEPNLITDCFVNINAIDFGIEIDRIAKMTIHRNAVIFDGEISGKVPVGAPIGLFPVDKINNTIENEHHTDFRPDRFFYNAKSTKYAGDRLERTIQKKYIPRLREGDVLSQKDVDDWHQAKEKDRHFDLCPVTRSLILRHIRHEEAQIAKRRRRKWFDFFLSWSAPDKKSAHIIYEYLTNRLGLSVYFSEITPKQTNFPRDIHEAIKKSKGMIVLASKPEYLVRYGVMFEWITFLGAIEDGRKPKSSPLINFISGFGYNRLPNQLSLYHAIRFKRGKINTGLTSLRRYLRKTGIYAKTP
jgi:hypothetical protein